MRTPIDITRTFAADETEHPYTGLLTTDIDFFSSIVGEHPSRISRSLRGLEKLYAGTQLATQRLFVLTDHHALPADNHGIAEDPVPLSMVEADEHGLPLVRPPYQRLRSIVRLVGRQHGLDLLFAYTYGNGFGTARPEVCREQPEPSWVEPAYRSHLLSALSRR